MAQADAVPAPAAPSAGRPVIIIGAGISGLLLAQHLKQEGIPFRVFERDTTFDTRGVGWGLTLNWALPTLRRFLTPELLDRVPDTYVDKQSALDGVSSRFPFFDLASGECKAQTPPLPESVRIRVLRERLRDVLASDIKIEWSKTFSSFVETEEAAAGTDRACRNGTTPSVTATFEDGSKCTGCLLVACDGSSSRVRRALFPKFAMENQYRIPIGFMGTKMSLTEEEISGVRDLDRYFLQGASSENDSFIYMSVLDVASNEANKANDYKLQMVLSWPLREGYLGHAKGLVVPEDEEGRLKLWHEFASTYAEPFRSAMLRVTSDCDIKALKIHDWAPPKGFRTTGNVVLMGDSLHQMSMYRGEGANHAVVDVADFADHVTPVLNALRETTSVGNDNTSNGEEFHAGKGMNGAKDASNGVNGSNGGVASSAEDSYSTPPRQVRRALDQYEDAVVARARPGVLASRRACLDAHEWQRIGPNSPLLIKRQMMMEYDEAQDRIVG